MCYKGILKQYPEAKVILTTCDNLDLWAQQSVELLSIQRRLFTTLPGKCVSRFLYCLIGQPSVFSKYIETINKIYKWDETQNKIDYTSLKQHYQNWQDEIKTNIPRHQLLIWGLSEGWEPLCDFLEVPIPDSPIPMFDEKLKILKFHTRIKWAVYLLFLTFWILMLFVVFKLVNVVIANED